MKTQEAIDLFENKLNDYPIGSLFTDLYPLRSIILSALREKEEREKGCEFCQIAQEQQIMVGSYKGDVFADSWQDVKYCPMCGRKLSVGGTNEKDSKTDTDK